MMSVCSIVGRSKWATVFVKSALSVTVAAPPFNALFMTGTTVLEHYFTPGVTWETDVVLVSKTVLAKQHPASHKIDFLKLKAIISQVEMVVSSSLY